MHDPVGSTSRRPWLRRVWRVLSVLFVIATLLLPQGMAATASQDTGEGSAAGSIGIAAKPTPPPDPDWPDGCRWNCTANDVVATGAWLGTAGGDPLTTCTPGDSVNATVWVDFLSTNPTRYSVVLVGDLYVGTGAPIDIDVCTSDVISGGMSIPLYTFSWTCGVTVDLQNLIVAWDANDTGECIQTCNTYPPAKCYSAAVLHVDAPLVAGFTSDSPQCLGTPITFTPSVSGGSEPYSLLWEFGDGTSETVGSTSPISHLYTVAGTYPVTLTVTDSSARVAQATGSATVSPGPDVTVEATGDALTCNVSSVVLTANATGGVPGYTYQWYSGTVALPGETGSTFTAYSAGSYSVEVTDSSGCFETSSETVVTRVPDPAVSISAPGSELNCSVSSILLTANVTGGEGPFTFQWFRNGTPVGTGNTYNASIAGTYTVQVTDGNECSDTSDELVITSVPSPEVSITAPGAELNCNVSSILLTADINGGEPPFTLQWYRDGSPAGTGPSLLVNLAGTYTVDVTDGNGCADSSDGFAVTEVPSPEVSISAPGGELNCNVSSILLTANVNGGEEPFSLQWYRDGSPVGTGSTYNATVAGSYTVSVSDNNECSDTSDPFVITEVNNVQVSISPEGGELNCSVSSVLLTANVTDGEAPFTYLWYLDGGAIGGAINSTYTAMGPGDYTVEVTDNNGCTDTSAPVTIVSVPSPSVSISPEGGELNCSVRSVLLTANVADGEAPFTYQWYLDGGAIGGAINSTYTAMGPGDYTVEATDNNGCTDTSAPVTIVSVPSPSVSVSPEGGELTCNVSSILLTASVSGGEEPFTYQWFRDGTPVGTGSTHLATAAGTYTVTVTDNNGCPDTSSPVVITSADRPEVSISAEETELSCDPEDFVTLMASVTGGTGPFTYTWFRGATQIGQETTDLTTAYLDVYQPGTYTVAVVDGNGCGDTSDDSVTVTVAEAPSVTIVAESTTLDCESGEALLRTVVTGGTPPYHYQWYLDGSPVGGDSSSHTATAAGTYYVVVTDANGCTGESSEVEIIECQEAGLSLDKTGNRTQAQVGDGIEYTITVENIGHIDLHDVTVVDAKLGIDSGLGTLAAGETGVVTGTYTVSESDLPGPIVNTARVTCEELDPAEDTWIVSLSEPPEPCVRSDVAVVIYGGWAGIPVQAWVGGTEQPTLSTEIDGSGQAAVNWTFYPPEGQTWKVRVAPQLPEELDPARWQYKLLRLEINSSQVIQHPSPEVSISRCSQYVFYYQLIDTGPKGTPTPIPLLPVTGEGQGTAQPGLVQLFASWWHNLLLWCKDLLGV